jgi:hypothetical protein
MPRFDSIPPPTAGQATERALDALHHWRLTGDPRDGESALKLCRTAERASLPGQAGCTVGDVRSAGWP